MQRTVTILVVSALASISHGAPQPGVERFRGAVDAPDVMGGYASTRIVVRVVEGVAPGTLADDRLTFVLLDRPENAALAARVAQVEAGIADVLERWGVTGVAPTADPAPRNAELASMLGLDRYYTVSLPAGSDSPGLVNRLGGFFTHIEAAELDGIGGILQTPDDPLFNQQYGLHNTGQTVNGQPGIPGADINALAAWGLHTGTDDIIVAVVDTGVSNSHPDLTPKLVQGRNFTSSDVNNTDDSWLIPHGTHVAGIAAAATDNGIGIAGVSWGARIMPIKVLNLFGSGNETDIANGVVWLADNGAHIANMSLGLPGGSTFFENAINYAHAEGVLLVAATGNTPDADIFAPARWANTVAVGATDNRDQIAPFTTTGPEMSVTAPGVDVISTWDSWLAPNSYTQQSGTSMASPHAAGLAALVWSANLSLTNEQVRGIIESTADDLGAPGWDPIFGHGRINAYEAVLAALDTGCPPDWNGDGVVDSDDLFDFLSDWAAGNADYNGDGVTDSDDLFDFLSDWAAGC